MGRPPLFPFALSRVTMEGDEPNKIRYVVGTMSHN